MKDGKITLMMVGCGAIAFEWLEALKGRDDAVITSLVDLNRPLAERRKQEYSLDCPVFEDVDIALAEARPDVLIDLTNAPAHFDITMKAFRAGCSVFGEKPMCMSREEGRILMEEAKRMGLTFNVMQNRRYLPGIRALRAAVRGGVLGKIWNVCCEIYVNSDLAGGRNNLEYPMLQDQAIHSFDSARFILGADALTVYCHSYNPEGSHYNGDGSGAAIFEMSDGSVLTYNAVMDTNAMKTAWHSQFRVIGSKGTAFWNGFDELPTAEIIAPDGSAQRQLLPLPADWDGIRWFPGGVNEMIAAYKEGREAETSCFGNYGSVAMTFSAIESARSGKKVEVK